MTTIEQALDNCTADISGLSVELKNKERDLVAVNKAVRETTEAWHRKARELETLRELSIIVSWPPEKLRDALLELETANAIVVTDDMTIAQSKESAARKSAATAKVRSCCPHIFIYHEKSSTDDDPYSSHHYPGHVRCATCGKVEYSSEEPERYNMLTSDGYLSVASERTVIMTPQQARALITKRYVEVMKAYGCAIEGET